jgi:hypothetical protein
VRLWQGRTTGDVGRNAESVPIVMAGKPGLTGHSERLLELKIGAATLVTFPTPALFVGQFQSYIMCNPRVGGFECANSGTRRRHEGAPPLVGESDLKPASELKP